MPEAFWDLVTDGYDGANYAESDWDFVVLNGIKSPGISVVTCKPSMRIDVQKPSGGDGSPLILRGHNPAKVDIAIEVWTPAQWLLLQEFMDVIWRRPGKDSRQDRPGQKTATIKATGAIEIQHPACRMYGVTAVVIHSPSSPERSPNGGRILRIDALQYTPQSGNTTRKAQGSGKVVPVTPELQRPKNVAGLPPSQTDARPFTPVPPSMGS